MPRMRRNSNNPNSMCMNKRGISFILFLLSLYSYSALVKSADKNNDGKVSPKEFDDLVARDFANKKYEEIPAWYLKRERERGELASDGRKGRGGTKEDESILPLNYVYAYIGSLSLL